MTYPGRIPGSVRIGMTAPLQDYAARLAETGPVLAQRIFCTGLNDDESAAVADAVAAGRLPVVSFKVGDWSAAASGAVDGAVQKALGRLSGPVAVAFHHEPAGDGDPATWAAMQARLLPMVRAAGLASAVILNGFWFGARGGLTDAQIATYLPKSVLAAADVVCGDFYESDRNQVADLLTNFLAWADRAGVTELGVGEWGTYTADGLTVAGKVLLDHADRFGFACWFDSIRNSRADWLLTGDRLAAFQALRDAAKPGPTVAELQAQITDLQAMLTATENECAALWTKVTAARDALA